jgi:cytochrome c2
MKRAVPFLLFLAFSCSEAPKYTGIGDVDRGKALIIQNGCYDCHVIPGIDRKPGPGVQLSLKGFATKSKMAYGNVEITPANVIAYVQRPKTVFPRATMPGIGENERDATDMAAYLLSLD